MDVKDRMRRKMIERAVANRNHYRSFEDQQKAIIRIAAEELLECLDEIRRRHFGKSPTDKEREECLMDIIDTSYDIFYEFDIPSLPSEVDIRGLITTEHIHLNQILK
jgi:NTP pyrophosphatase (non-canonical NTP hydrolase)